MATIGVEGTKLGTKQKFQKRRSRELRDRLPTHCREIYAIVLTYLQHLDGTDIQVLRAASFLFRI